MSRGSIRYEGDIYRPPSEGNSLILQATIGCSHNRCTFCSMYKSKKFRQRPLNDLFEDINAAALSMPGVKRVFLADGNALAIKTEQLIKILQKLGSVFPRLERVSVYAGPQDLLGKSTDEFKALAHHRLKMIYLGVESGSAEVLNSVCKGATPEEMVLGADRVKEGGIPLSVTVINGLAGVEGMEQHARETARLLNVINPDYLGLLTLMVVPGTTISRQVEAGKLTILSPYKIMQEIYMMVEALRLTNCIFRANHASNYLPIKAVLSKDRGSLLAALNSILHQWDPALMRGESLRRL